MSKKTLLPNHNNQIRETLETVLQTKDASAVVIITIDVDGYLNYATWGIEDNNARALLEEVLNGYDDSNLDDEPRPKYLN